MPRQSIGALGEKLFLFAHQNKSKRPPRLRCDISTGFTYFPRSSAEVFFPEIDAALQLQCTSLSPELRPMLSMSPELTSPNIVVHVTTVAATAAAQGHDALRNGQTRTNDTLGGHVPARDCSVDRLDRCAQLPSNQTSRAIPSTRGQRNTTT